MTHWLALKVVYAEHHLTPQESDKKNRSALVVHQSPVTEMHHEEGFRELILNRIEMVAQSANHMMTGPLLLVAIASLILL